MNTIIYDREVLYREVWIDPVTIVAQRYGISGNGLKKNCIELNVPLPPPGYWSQLRASIKVMKPPLPKSNGQDRIVVHKHHIIKEVPMKTKSQRLETLPEGKRLEIELYCKDLIVPNELNRPHYLVRDTMQYKKSVKESTRPPVDNCLKINASDEHLDRALRIMDTVLKAIEILGYTIKNKRSDTRICIGGEEIKIGIKEKLKQVPHVKTEEERKHEAKYKYSNAPRFDFISTGYMQFHIDEWHAPRQNWNDTDRKKLESEIGDIVITIVETGEALRILYEQRKEEEIRRRQNELERMRLQEQREKEMKRISMLEARANDYKKAMAIQDYINALNSESSNMEDTEESWKVQDYIIWAQAKADWMNPLVNKQDKVLGRKYKSLIDEILDED